MNKTIEEALSSFGLSDAMGAFSRVVEKTKADKESREQAKKQAMAEKKAKAASQAERQTPATPEEQNQDAAPATPSLVPEETTLEQFQHSLIVFGDKDEVIYPLGQIAVMVVLASKIDVADVKKALLSPTDQGTPEFHIEGDNGAYATRAAAEAALEGMAIPKEFWDELITQKGQVEDELPTSVFVRSATIFEGLRIGKANADFRKLCKNLVINNDEVEALFRKHVRREAAIGFFPRKTDFPYGDRSIIFGSAEEAVLESFYNGDKAKFAKTPGSVLEEIYKKHLMYDVFYLDFSGKFAEPVEDKSIRNRVIAEFKDAKKAANATVSAVNGGDA